MKKIVKHEQEARRVIKKLKCSKKSKRFRHKGHRQGMTLMSKTFGF